jgi:hypothetical protein
MTQELEKHQSTQNEMAGEWADFVLNVVSQLTSENVALTYYLNNVRISVPGSAGNGSEDSGRAHWIVNGSITVRGTKG